MKQLPRTILSRRAAIALPLALALSATLGACKKQEEASAPLADSTEAMPDAKPGLAASKGVLILSPVAGRPGAAYFEVRNDSGKPTALAGVYIEGVSKTEMHKSEGGSMAPVDKVDLAPGQTVEFAQGGLHVMAFDISPSLTKGGSTEMTLTFAGGDKLSMPIKIDTLGSDHGGMMDHGAMESEGPPR